MENYKSMKDVLGFIKRWNIQRILIICKDRTTAKLLDAQTEVRNLGFFFDPTANDDQQSFYSDRVVVTTSATMKNGPSLDKFRWVVGFKLLVPEVNYFHDLWQDALEDEEDEDEDRNPKPARPVAGKGIRSLPVGITPLKLEVLLHYHCSPKPYPIRSMAVTDAILYWERNGIICEIDEEDDDADVIYTTTDKGKVYVEALCSIPLPVSKTTWVIPAGGDQ